MHAYTISIAVLLCSTLVTPAIGQNAKFVPAVIYFETGDSLNARSIVTIDGSTDGKCSDVGGGYLRFHASDSVHQIPYGEFQLFEILDFAYDNYEGNLMCKLKNAGVRILTKDGKEYRASFESLSDIHFILVDKTSNARGMRIEEFAVSRGSSGCSLAIRKIRFLN